MLERVEKRLQVLTLLSNDVNQHRGLMSEVGYVGIASVEGFASAKEKD